MKAVKLIAIAFLSISPAPLWAGMIDKEGVEPYEICALCHGLNGNSHIAKFPKLGGQSSLYIQKQLRDFLSRHRENDGGQMASIVTEITLEDIPIVAKWFANQPAPEPAEADEFAKTGEGLFDQLDCAKCHAGKTQSPLIPQLGAQHKRYLEKQMIDFREGDRTNDMGAVMQKMMKPLSEADISALASYLASQPRAK